MKDNRTFSAVLNNYNYGHFITESIESVLAQTLQPSEIIVVDDGSTDDSASIVRRRFGKSVRVVETENRGQLHAFITGRRHATMEFIAFLDADDVWLPDHLSTIDCVLAKNPGVDFVLGNCERFGLRTGPYFDLCRDIDYGQTRHTAVTREWIGAPTSALVVSRELLSFLDQLPETLIDEWRMRADDVLVFGGSILGGHKLRLARPTVGYRVHGSNGHFGATRSAEGNRKYEAQRSRLFDYLMSLSNLDRSTLLDVFYDEVISSPCREITERRRVWRRMRKFGVLPWRDAIRTFFVLYVSSLVSGRRHDVSIPKGV